MQKKKQKKTTRYQNDDEQNVNRMFRHLFSSSFTGKLWVWFFLPRGKIALHILLCSLILKVPTLKQRMK